MIKINKVSAFLFLVVCIFLVSKVPAAKAAYSDEGTAFFSMVSSSGYIFEGARFYANTSQTSDTMPVYRFYNKTTGDHFYTISQSDIDIISSHPEWNYVNEDIVFYAGASQVSGSLPIYRFYNSNTGDHFYTSSQDDVKVINDNPQWGYNAEGIVFYAYDTQVAGTMPVYRFYNSKTGDHFYTISEDEKNQISLYPVYRFYNRKTGDHFYTASFEDVKLIESNPNWNYLSEGVAFYANTAQVNGSYPVYRFYNSKTGDHFYTISQNDVDTINSNPQWGYNAEGIAFYAFDTQVSGTMPIFRFFNPTTGDHFYTASVNEKNYLLNSILGPEISVGLWYYTKTDFLAYHFNLDANKAFNVRDENGTIIGQISANTKVAVSYNDSSNYFTVTGGALHDAPAGKSILFDAADADNSNIIFNTHRSDYVASDWRGTIDRYRGKIKLQYFRDTNVNPSTQIWVDNVLPLEQYTWGSAETSGTGNINHTKVMTTAFRTFGYRHLNAPKYVAFGFRVRSDSLDQNYGGYDWEYAHPNIRSAAEQTRGVLVTYGGSPATTPYSSWSDGWTVGSSTYAWCQSRKDDYGNYNDSYWGHSPTKSHAELVALGNHMVGIVAWGSVRMANEGWNWQDIMGYYYKGIGLTVGY